MISFDFFSFHFCCLQFTWWAPAWPRIQLDTYSHSSHELVQLLNSIRFHHANRSRNYISRIASDFISLKAKQCTHPSDQCWALFHGTTTGVIASQVKIMVAFYAFCSNENTAAQIVLPDLFYTALVNDC